MGGKNAFKVALYFDAGQTAPQVFLPCYIHYPDLSWLGFAGLPASLQPLTEEI